MHGQVLMIAGWVMIPSMTVGLLENNFRVEIYIKVSLTDGLLFIEWIASLSSLFLNRPIEGELPIIQPVFSLL